MLNQGFQQFRNLCKECVEQLNQQEGYLAEYVKRHGLLITQHDAEYLEVVHRQPELTVKMHFVWSLAYQQPQLYFLVYDGQRKPLSASAISEKFLESREELRPKQQHGIFLTVQPITQENMFSLHGCQLKLEGKVLLSFYFSLLGLHPQL